MGGWTGCRWAQSPSNQVIQHDQVIRSLASTIFPAFPQYCYGSFDGSNSPLPFDDQPFSLIPKPCTCHGKLFTRWPSNSPIMTTMEAGNCMRNLCLYIHIHTQLLYHYSMNSGGLGHHPNLTMESDLRHTHLPRPHKRPESCLRVACPPGFSKLCSPYAVNCES